MTYQPLNEDTALAYVKQSPLMGSVFAADDELHCVDLADGNVNLVFRVYAASDPVRKSVIVKQALPWVRVVGESFPMPLDRARIEARILEVEARWAPGLVPRPYLFDPEMYVQIMEDLNQHVIMRKGLVKQVKYPRFAADMGRFLARTLFYTSDLYMDSTEKKKMVAEMQNPALCKISEDLIFTDPYTNHPDNDWNRLLDPQAEAMRADDALKGEIFAMKEAFMTHAEALIHGDLHTGSVMLNQEETRVIDPEFGFVGPMGFDIGAVLGNLALSYASQHYHAPDEAARVDYQGWLLDAMAEVWATFEEEFRRLWETEGRDFGSPAYREQYMLRLLQDTAGFAGCKMMRRILGWAHVSDLQSIPDLEKRAYCESLALNIGRAFVMQRKALRNIEDLLAIVREAKSSFTYA